MEKTSKKIERVAFLGDATMGQRESDYALVKKTAELLAKNGIIVVDGGGSGVMRAATEGAKAGGGRVEVVIIDQNKEPGNYEGADEENLKLADEVYQTNNYQERLNKLVELADAFVVFRGGTGTLSEVGLVWEMAKFDYGHHEPVVFVGREWEAVVKTITEKMGFEEKEKRVVKVVMTAEEVWETLARVGN